MGIWIINGPKQPMGLTPASLYRAIVSCCIFCLFCASFLGYFFCIACNFGCSSCIFFICLVCRIVRGIKISRIKIVNDMIDNPKLSLNKSYRNAKLLIIGFIMIEFQIKLIKLINLSLN